MTGKLSRNKDDINKNLSKLVVQEPTFFCIMNTPKSIAILKSIGFWIAFLALLYLAGTLISPVFPSSWERFVYGIGGTLAALGLTWLFIRFEQLSFSDYGLTWQSATITRFIKGFLIGTGIFVIIIFLMICFGGLSIHLSGNWNPVSSFWYLSIIPLALMEELAFRGYPFIKLNKAFGLPLTQLIVALAFAIYHIVTGWDITVALLGPGIWAFVFGLGAAWSKGIALPTGIHVALNLSQQVVGMKDGKAGSVWILSENQSAALIPADTVGIICQVLAGVVAIILTIWYTRKK